MVNGISVYNIYLYSRHHISSQAGNDGQVAVVLGVEAADAWPCEGHSGGSTGEGVEPEAGTWASRSMQDVRCVEQKEELTETAGESHSVGCRLC